MYEQETRFLEQNILNIGYGLYDSDNEYGIPTLEPVIIDKLTTMPLQGFNFAKSDKHPQGKGVHFFLHDYQFERVWKYPVKYTDMLKRFAFCLTPDFSPYADMPEALKIYNVYRNRWVGRFWQEHDITVIPTITWSDENSLKYCFAGVPKHSTIAVSTMGEGRWAKWQSLKAVWPLMLDILEPHTILLYGKDLRDELDGNIIYKQIVSSAVAV